VAAVMNLFDSTQKVKFLMDVATFAFSIRDVSDIRQNCVCN